MQSFIGTLAGFSMALALMAPTPVAASNSTVRLVVVPSASSLDGKARHAVQRQIEGKLASEFALVPTTEYTDQATAMGYAAKNQATRRAAAEIGAAVDVTHVLLLTGKGKKRKRARNVDATLVAVGTGEVMSLGKFALRRGALDRRANAALAQSLKRKLDDGSASDSDALFDEPSDGEATETAAAEPMPEGDASDDPFQQLPSTSSSNPWLARAPVEDTAVKKTVTMQDKRRRRLGTGFAASVGAAAIRRDATVTGVGGRPHAYRTNAAVPGISVQLELFPMALLGSNGIGANFGLTGRGFATRISSATPNGGDAVNSDVWSAEGALTYRTRLWRSDSAPHLAATAGFGRFAFPLQSDRFPGVAYQGPQGGLALIVPIGSYVSLSAEGAYTWPVMLADEVAELGDLDGGATHAWSAGGGMKVSIGMLSVSASARVQQFGLTFKGPARLDSYAGSSDVVVSDRLISGHLGVGLAL